MKGERHFRWRGGEVSRLEGLADAVFAISLTLLVVSLEVPATFGEMVAAFASLPAFAICFALLILVWFYHYQFHRRYGLEDGPTIVYNAVLLFLVLFYVYPLKFLFHLLAKMAAGEATVEIDGASVPMITGNDMSTLMMLYSGGSAGIFALFALMTWHAWRKRGELELTPAEELITRSSIAAHLLSTAIAVVSILMAATGRQPLVTLSGFIYFLMGPVHGLNGWMWGKRIEATAASGVAAAGEPPVDAGS